MIAALPDQGMMKESSPVGRDMTTSTGTLHFPFRITEQLRRIPEQMETADSLDCLSVGMSLFETCLNFKTTSIWGGDCL